jgi:hypothetical protein
MNLHHAQRGCQKLERNNLSHGQIHMQQSVFHPQCLLRILITILNYQYYYLGSTHHQYEHVYHLSI